MTDGSDSPDRTSAEPTVATPNADPVARFRELVPADPAVSFRQMFGSLTVFANGYMFAGLHDDAVFIRIDDAGQASVIESGGTVFAPMPGRAMRGYVVLPQAWTQESAVGRTWLERSLAHTLALPPKAPKASKPKKRPTTPR